MTERIDERLQAMGVDASGMTDEQKFTVATGLTHYNEDNANNPWYVPGGVANVLPKSNETGTTEPVGPTGETEPVGPTGETEPVGPTGETSPTGEHEAQTYTAEEAAAYNAQLPGAVKAGDIQTPAVEGQEAVEAQPAKYAFESFNNAAKEVKYGEGTVKVIEMRAGGATIEVVSNTSTDPNAANFVGQQFNIATALATNDPIQLYTLENEPVDIWVTVELVSEAIEAQEAIAAVEEVLYTEETAAAYNAQLDGAVKEGDPKTSTAEIETEG